MRIQVKAPFRKYADGFQRAAGQVTPITHSYLRILGSKLNKALQKNVPKRLNDVTIYSSSQFQVTGNSIVTTITLRGKPLRSMAQLAQVPDAEVNQALDPRIRKDNRPPLEATRVNGEPMIRRKPKPQPEKNIDYHVKTLKDTRGLRGHYSKLILKRIAQVIGR